MQKYARIDVDKTMELFSTDENISKLFHPSIEWVDITRLEPAPLVGWLYTDGAFSEPGETRFL